MSFFDKKTDVIKIELTQYGKHLLSKGKFKPVYYEFFDNDVLYDGEYANINEERNDIQERIKNHTPYLKPQYNFSGVETKLKTQNELKKKLQNTVNHSEIRIPDIIGIQNIEEKINITSYPLGTSMLNGEYPAIKIYSGDTEISSSSKYNDSSGYIIHIPQIIMKKSEYNFIPKNISDTNINLNNIKTNLFSDGESYFEIEEETVLLKLEETNAKNIKQNFEIEFFEITSSNGRDVYLPLYFAQQQNKIDINCVEYYFEVHTDEKIQSTEIQKIDSKLTNPALFARIK